jgi:methylthioribose-1-phosphate isomerase
VSASRLAHLLGRPPLSGATYSAAEITARGNAVVLLEQRRLPGVETYVTCRTSTEVAWAIRDMVVRGAPAIGIAAAYGLAIASVDESEAGAFLPYLRALGDELVAARPTAVNLAWAVRRMVHAGERVAHAPGPDRFRALCAEAESIHREDVLACRAMGARGAALFGSGVTVLTHCNAGALATGGYGTALGLVRALHHEGKLARVLADETRPYWQGARLTAWELSRDGIPVEVLTDGMAGHFMRRGDVSAVVVGADRVARNGDVANKIGTYGLAVLAKHHGLPFYVVAPDSTLDPETPRGDAIVIEERSSDEVVRVGDKLMVPEGVRARHPAFDVTPRELVTAIITESAVHRPGDGVEVLPAASR